MLTFHETAYSLEQGVFHNNGEHFAPPTIPFSQSHESSPIHRQLTSLQHTLNTGVISDESVMRRPVSRASLTTFQVSCVT